MSGVKLERSLAVRLSQMARNPTLVGARGIRTTPRRSVDVAAPGVRWFKVVGSTLIGDNRWSYSLQDIDDSDVIVSALNKMEDANTADEAGPSYDIAGLPTGLVLLPIGKDRNGIDIECVVDAWLGDDDDGNEVWWFSKTNVVDGECSTGSGGGDALVSDGLDQFAPTTSAELASIISDPTGTGELVFASSPTLVTPTLGVAAATSLNKVAVTAPATGATLTIADGKTLTASDNATVSGTNTGDQTSVTGNAGTVTVADAGGDATTWPLLGTSQTGSLAPATDAGLTYDASSNTLTAGAFVGMGVPIIAYKSADQTAIGTSFADVSGTGIAVAASTTYRFEFWLLCDSDATTTGIDLSVNGPASPTAIHYEVTNWSSATAQRVAGEAAYDTVTTPNVNSSGATTRLYRIVGILVNGSNAGTLIARAKREAVGSGPNVRAGSFGIAWKVA